MVRFSAFPRGDNIAIMANEEAQTFELLGRDMPFRRPSQGQLLLLQRIAQRSRREIGDDAEAMGKAYTALMARMLDIIDTLFINPQDRDDVEEAVLNRQLDVEDLMPILRGKPTEPPVADDEDPPPVKRKAPKAAAKKAAPRRGRA